MTCGYCGGSAQLVTGVAIYPRRPEFAEHLFYRCAPCDAYVGCHQGTSEPMGLLADAELRRARVEAHQALDRVWQSGTMQRKKTYRWLAKHLGIDPKQCHIGMFDVAQCRRVVDVVRENVVGAAE